MEPKVNQDICIGCGTCAALCPKGFKLGTNGKSEVVSGADKACYKKAAQNCPVQAINLK